MGQTKRRRQPERDGSAADRRRSVTMRRRAQEGRLTGRLAATLTDLEMAAMLHGGATLNEIGRQAGVTRERVRQRLARIGVAPAKRVDVTRVVDVVRNQPVDSYSAVARLARVSAAGAYRALWALGLTDAVERLFRLRVRARRQERRDRATLALRSYAATLGRTPGARDLVGLRRPDCIPSLSTYRELFGSLGRAQRAAALQPNGQGRRARANSERPA